jgi:hypothetical protein
VTFMGPGNLLQLRRAAQGAVKKDTGWCTEDGLKLQRRPAAQGRWKEVARADGGVRNTLQRGAAARGR